MQGFRLRARVSLLSAGLAALALLVAAPWAASATGVAIGEGGGASLATDPSSGRTLAITGKVVPDGDGFVSGDLYSRVLSERGRPLGSARRIGGGQKPNLIFASGGQATTTAVDSRRHRHLVAWEAHKPGMGRSPCPPPPPQPPPAPGTPFIPPFPNQPACVIKDTEIFVRLLDRSGRPLGGELKVSDIGPPDRGELFASAPVVAYDERADSYLLVYAAAVTADDTKGALFVQRIKPNGFPDGPATRLAGQPELVSTGPLTRLAADPKGGFLLAYTWGADFTSRGIYAQRLNAAGQLAGPTRLLAAPAGRGAGTIELAFDRRSRRALLISSTSAPGSSGFQAQQLLASGRPATAPVKLPNGGGNGPVIAAAGPRRGSWTYAFTRRAERLANHVFVQRATAGGRPLGRARRVTSVDARALGPQISALSRGRLLVGWGQEGVSCRGRSCTSTGAMTARVRVIRP